MMVESYERELRYLGERLGITPGDVAGLNSRIEVLIAAEFKLDAAEKEIEDRRQKGQTRCACEFDGDKQVGECFVHREQRIALESRLHSLQTKHDAVERGYFSEMKRAHEAMNALTEIYRLADGISDEMTLPEIGTIALGAIQKPVVERQSP
jgi:hypothetical protein